ncbi:hypothetical protein MUO83_02360 [Candidatus Bathyarchaeota archaeon]|jgi:hypothetical protein|nr:hypothetical protein [Candidatus Bathyarchaeota archaeon]
MKKSDFQLIGYIGFVLGALLMGGGILGYNYYTDFHVWATIGGHLADQLAQDCLVLLVAGIVLLVIGLAFLWRAKQEGAPTQATLPKPPD